MDAGDEAILRATEERVRVVAVLDASGTCLVESGDATFEATREELATLWERHAGCGCCG